MSDSSYEPLGPIGKVHFRLPGEDALPHFDPSINTEIEFAMSDVNWDAIDRIRRASPEFEEVLGPATSAEARLDEITARVGRALAQEHAIEQDFRAMYPADLFESAPHGMVGLASNFEMFGSESIVLSTFSQILQDAMNASKNEFTEKPADVPAPGDIVRIQSDGKKGVVRGFWITPSGSTRLSIGMTAQGEQPRHVTRGEVEILGRSAVGEEAELPDHLRGYATLKKILSYYKRLGYTFKVDAPKRPIEERLPASLEWKTNDEDAPRDQKVLIRHNQTGEVLLATRVSGYGPYWKVENDVVTRRISRSHVDAWAEFNISEE